MSFTLDYLIQVAAVTHALAEQPNQIEDMVSRLNKIRNDGGTVYILGLGGSAANATHMAADLKKMCAINTRTLDNIAELTARANDEGWETIFDGLLNQLAQWDAIFVLSVGGGTREVSTPLMKAIRYAKEAGATIFGIVGPHGGYTAEHGDCVIKIPAFSNQTPLTESFQAIIWHALCTHPSLQMNKPKW